MASLLLGEESRFMILKDWMGMSENQLLRTARERVDMEIASLLRLNGAPTDGIQGYYR